MKKVAKVFLKILKWLLIALIFAIIFFFTVRFVGQKINGRTPQGGINESMYVEINGSKQWVSIYGEDLNNPVYYICMAAPVHPQVLMIMHSQESGRMYIQLSHGIKETAEKVIQLNKMIQS